MNFTPAKGTPDGTILILSVMYENSPRVFDYAALKTPNGWYLTGGNTPQAAGWGAVQRWLDRDGRKLVKVREVTEQVTIWTVPSVDTP